MIAVDTLVSGKIRRFGFRAYRRAGERADDMGRRCVHEFLAIVTHPRIYDPPTPMDLAIAQVEAWLESPTLVLLSETPAHWLRLREYLSTGRVAGPRVHDARVAALCRQHEVRALWSADRDFSRFAGLAVTNPLTG